MKLKDSLLPLLAIIGFVLIAAARLLPAADGIEPQAARDMVQKGALLLDVREPSEFADTHVSDARLIPLGQLGGRLSEIDSYKNKPIVVMCRSGHRSSRAAEQLREAGFTQVISMRGGIKAWESDGLEVVHGK